MYSNVRKFLPDHKVLFDQRVAFVGRHFEPVFMLRTRIHKMILGRPGEHPRTIFAGAIDKHHPLRRRKIIVRRLKIAAEIRPVHHRRHFLDQIERRSDTPKHQIGLRIETDERIAEQHKIVAKSIENTLKFALKNALCIDIQLAPFGTDAKEHEVDELFLDARKYRHFARLRHQPQAAFALFFLKIDHFHMGDFGFLINKFRRRVMRLLCQVSPSKSKTRDLKMFASVIGSAFTNRPINAIIVEMIRPITMLVLLVSMCFAASAQQRPLLTDDIDITPAGALEIGAGVDFLQNAKFPLSGIKGDLTRLGDIRIRTGLAPNVEMQIEGVLQNFVAINSQTVSPIPLSVTGNSTNDFDDFTVSAKIKLRAETKYLPAIGLKFGYQMPNSDQARGIGTNSINVFTKVIVQKKFGSVLNRTAKFNLFGNIGLAIMTAPLETFSQNDVILYGVAAIYRVNGRINIVSEINGRANTRPVAPIGTESTGQFRVGTQIRASGLRFDAAAAFGLTKFSPRTGVIFGVTYQSPTIFTPAR